MSFLFHIKEPNRTSVTLAKVPKTCHSFLARKCTSRRAGCSSGQTQAQRSVKQPSWRRRKTSSVLGPFLVRFFFCRLVLSNLTQFVPVPKLVQRAIIAGKGSRWVDVKDCARHYSDDIRSADDVC